MLIKVLVLLLKKLVNFLTQAPKPNEDANEIAKRPYPHVTFARSSSREISLSKCTWNYIRVNWTSLVPIVRKCLRKARIAITTLEPIIRERTCYRVGFAIMRRPTRPIWENTFVFIMVRGRSNVTFVSMWPRSRVI